MNLEILTLNDLKAMKEEILAEIKQTHQLNQDENIWLKSSEVRKLLSCSEGTLINLRASGMLPYSKVNGTIYIRKSDLNKLLNSNIVA